MIMTMRMMLPMIASTFESMSTRVLGVEEWVGEPAFFEVTEEGCVSALRVIRMYENILNRDLGGFALEALDESGGRVSVMAAIFPYIAPSVKA